MTSLEHLRRIRQFLDSLYRDDIDDIDEYDAAQESVEQLEAILDEQAEETIEEA